MIKFIGIDPGTKRIGLARGDELGLASPLAALVQPDVEERWLGLLAVISNEEANELVLGYPLNMDDSVGPKAVESEKLAERLRQETGLPVHLGDERLTSHEAESSVPKSELRGIRGSGVVDSRAATLILQDYLDQRYPPQMLEESW